MARPLSEAQRAACQQNAAKSTGPRTAAGKAKARLNAVKHGLTAKLPVLPFENAEDFEALKAGFEKDFAPQNTYQKFLVTQLATHAWRILRSQQVEIGLQELLMKEVIHQLHTQGHDTQQALTQNPYAGLALTLQPLQDDPQNHTLRNLFRYLRGIQSDFHRTQKALAQAQKPVESTTPRSVSSPAESTGTISTNAYSDARDRASVPAPQPEPALGTASGPRDSFIEGDPITPNCAFPRPLRM